MSFPNFEYSPYLKATVEKASFVQHLYEFVAPQLGKEMSSEIRKREIQRITSILTQEKIKTTKDQVALCFGKSGQSEEVFPYVEGFRKADKYLKDRISGLQFLQLKKVHEILLRRTPQDKSAAVINHWSEDQLDYLEELVVFIGTENELPPLMHAIASYIYVDVLKPFVAYNQALAMLVFQSVLYLRGHSFDGLLSFENFLGKEWNLHQSLKMQSLFPTSNLDRMNSSQTALFENCAKYAQDALLDIEDAALHWLKKSISYDSLEPIRRNSINYIMERGLKNNHWEISALSPRQKRILFDVAFNRSVHTKSMVMKYRCDRKTIQRDFSILTDKGLITQEGKTKTVIYLPSFN